MTSAREGVTDETVIVGRLVGVYGIKGWLKVESFTRPRENVFSYTPWLIKRDGEWRAQRVVTGRPQGKGLVVKLEGIDDRDRAATLVGTEVAIRRDQLPASEDDEVYWSDLTGLLVENTDGVPFGRVVKLLETGANDVLVIDGERERLVPFIRPDYVVDVDLAGGKLIVDWDADF